MADAGHEEVRALHAAVAEVNRLATALTEMDLRVTAEILEVSSIGHRPSFHLTVEVLRPIPPGPACSHCEDGMKWPEDAGRDGLCPKCGGDCIGF